MLANLEYEFARIKNDVNLRLYELAPGNDPYLTAHDQTTVSPCIMIAMLVIVGC